MQPTIMTQDHYSKQELHFLETDSNKNRYLLNGYFVCVVYAVAIRAPCT